MNSINPKTLVFLLCWTGFLSSCERPEKKSEVQATPVSMENADEKPLRKYYVISSPHSKRRYPTWKSEILLVGAVRFKTMDQGGRVMVVSQPYEIEERNTGKGW